MLEMSLLQPVAFDYGATLRHTDGLQGMRDLVGVLNRAGVPCVVISAVTEGWDPAPILAELAQLVDSHGHPLRFAAVRFTTYPPNPTTVDAIATGHKKAQAMRELGAALLFDDSHHVCAVVNSLPGLEAVCVRVAAL